MGEAVEHLHALGAGNRIPARGRHHRLFHEASRRPQHTNAVISSQFFPLDAFCLASPPPRGQCRPKVPLLLDALTFLRAARAEVNRPPSRTSSSLFRLARHPTSARTTRPTRYPKPTRTPRPSAGKQL